MATDQAPVVQCGICLEENVEEVGELSGCAHIFCAPCITRWSGTENRCPTCRERFGVITRKRLAPEGGHDDNQQGPIKRLRGQVLETVNVEDKKQQYRPDDLLALDLDNLRCSRCGTGEDEHELMLCDGCDRGFHIYCVGLRSLPEDEWYCEDCAATQQELSQAARGRQQQRRAGGSGSGRAAARRGSRAPSGSGAPRRRLGRASNSTTVWHTEVIDLEDDELLDDDEVWLEDSGDSDGCDGSGSGMDADSAIVIEDSEDEAPLRQRQQQLLGRRQARGAASAGRRSGGQGQQGQGSSRAQRPSRSARERDRSTHPGTLAAAAALTGALAGRAGPGGASGSRRSRSLREAVQRQQPAAAAVRAARRRPASSGCPVAGLDGDSDGGDGLRVQRRAATAPPSRPAAGPGLGSDPAADQEAVAAIRASWSGMRAGEVEFAAVTRERGERPGGRSRLALGGAGSGMQAGGADETSAAWRAFEQVRALPLAGGAGPSRAPPPPPSASQRPATSSARERAVQAAQRQQLLPLGPRHSCASSDCPVPPPPQPQAAASAPPPGRQPDSQPPNAFMRYLHNAPLGRSAAPQSQAQDRSRPRAKPARQGQPWLPEILRVDSRPAAPAPTPRAPAQQTAAPPAAPAPAAASADAKEETKARQATQASLGPCVQPPSAPAAWDSDAAQPRAPWAEAGAGTSHHAAAGSIFAGAPAEGDIPAAGRGGELPWREPWGSAATPCPAPDAQPSQSHRDVAPYGAASSGWGVQDSTGLLGQPRDPATWPAGATGSAHAAVQQHGTGSARYLRGTDQPAAAAASTCLGRSGASSWAGVQQQPRQQQQQWQEQWQELQQPESSRSWGLCSQQPEVHVDRQDACGASTQFTAPSQGSRQQQQQLRSLLQHQQQQPSRPLAADKPHARLPLAPDGILVLDSELNSPAWQRCQPQPSEAGEACGTWQPQGGVTGLQQQQQQQECFPPVAQQGTLLGFMEGQLDFPPVSQQGQWAGLMDQQQQGQGEGNQYWGCYSQQQPEQQQQHITNPPLPFPASALPPPLHPAASPPAPTPRGRGPAGDVVLGTPYSAAQQDHHTTASLSGPAGACGFPSDAQAPQSATAPWDPTCTSDPAPAAAPGGHAGPRGFGAYALQPVQPPVQCPVSPTASPPLRRTTHLPLRLSSPAAALPLGHVNHLPLGSVPLGSPPAALSLGHTAQLPAAWATGSAEHGAAGGFADPCSYQGCSQPGNSQEQQQDRRRHGRSERQERKHDQQRHSGAEHQLSDQQQPRGEEYKLHVKKLKQFAYDQVRLLLKPRIQHLKKESRDALLHDAIRPLYEALREGRVSLEQLEGEPLLVWQACRAALEPHGLAHLLDEAGQQPEAEAPSPPPAPAVQAGPEPSGCDVYDQPCGPEPPSWGA